MNRIIDLRTALLDLLKKVHDSEIKLIAGGGFGIYLKTEHVIQSSMRTLLDQWPEPRSTNDLDLFLRPEGFEIFFLARTNRYAPIDGKPLLQGGIAE